MSQRFPDGRRYITSLSTVGRAEGGGVSLGEVVSFDEGSRSWRLVGEPGFVQRALDEGTLEGGEVGEWRRSVC